LHTVLGKASFGDQKLLENYQALLDEVLRSKPAASKGKYIIKAAMSATTGPGIPLDATAKPEA
jgi:large subunit ribosomal protein L1